MTMSRHASFYFHCFYHETEFFKVKWLNSHIYYELCGYKDIATWVRKHGCELR